MAGHGKAAVGLDRLVQSRQRLAILVDVDLPWDHDLGQVPFLLLVRAFTAHALMLLRRFAGGRRP